jgi:hypothetical protein
MPDPEQPGTYFRVEHDIRSNTVTYIWNAEGADAT